jgi:N-acetylneuraminic acid mutarotase
MSRRLLIVGLVGLIAGGTVAIMLSMSAGGNGVPPRASLSQRWISLQPALLKRTEVAAVRIRRFIYVVGGFEQQTRSTTAAVERYDITRNRWRRVKSMPVGLNHPAAAAYRDDVYVLGGYTGRGDLRGEVSSLLRYDPVRNRWTRLPSAPTKRAALAVGVIKGKLYAAGGANATAGALKTLEIYDFKRRRWSRGPDLSMAREHLAGTVAGGAFYVLAGRAAGQGNFTIAERYMPDHRRWERLPDMRKPRGGIAAATVGDRVVVFGGEEASGTIKEVEMFQPSKRRWTALPDLRTPRHGLGGISRGRRIYAIEGGPTPGFDFSNAIEALDIAPVRVTDAN